MEDTATALQWKNGFSKVCRVTYEVLISYKGND